MLYNLRNSEKIQKQAPFYIFLLLSKSKVSLSLSCSLWLGRHSYKNKPPPLMSTHVKKTSVIHHSWINFSFPSIWGRFLASSCSCHWAQMKLRLRCCTMWPQSFPLLFIRSTIDNRRKDSYNILSVIPQTFALFVLSLFHLCSLFLYRNGFPH